MEKKKVEVEVYAADGTRIFIGQVERVVFVNPSDDILTFDADEVSMSKVYIRRDAVAIVTAKPVKAGK